jgi:protein tyrosine/serine phosphatase
VYQREVAFTPATVFNFRDLGGAPTVDGRSVHYGRLYRSDSLHRMTEAECEQLCSLGVRTVLDLRRPYEIERDGRIRDTAGLAYFNLHPQHREWNPAGYDPADGPARFLADRYLDMADEGAAGFGDALRLIAEPRHAPVVMHCFAGKDRTGVLSALVLSLLGVADQHVAADYALSERAQASVSAQILADSAAEPRSDGTAGSGATAGVTPPIAFVVCPPEAIMIFLTGLRQRYGSVGGFAAHAGVSEGHLASLRAHLLT